MATELKTKIGKFVTKEHYQLSETEKDYVSKKLVELLDKHIMGNKRLNLGAYRIEYTFGVCLNTIDVIFEKPVSGRNYMRARFNNVSGFGIYISKETGVLEIDWKNKVYEPYYGYIYTISVKAHGQYKPYRWRRSECFSPIGFDYDADLQELIKDNLYNAVKHFADSIENIG